MHILKFMVIKVNSLITKILTVDVSGSGETSAQALESAFKDLRVQASKQITGSIISMNAQEVHVTSKETKSKTEKFLYLLFPREILSWVLHLKITVEIKYINIEED